MSERGSSVIGCSTVSLDAGERTLRRPPGSVSNPAHMSALCAGFDTPDVCKADISDVHRDFRSQRRPRRARAIVVAGRAASARSTASWSR
jgi:hypothetical protein